MTKNGTVKVRAGGVRLDFDDEDGLTVLVKDKGAWVELHEIWELFPREIPNGVVALLVFFAVEILVIGVVTVILRYVSEAALIQMVNTTEKTGERLGIRQGFRLGWSRMAWRLFTVDVLVYLPVALFVVLMFGLAISPLALWTTGSQTAGVAGTIVSVGMLVVVISLAIAISIVLAPVLQIIRRACAVEQRSTFSAIGRGLSIVRRRPLEVSITWLIWMGIRIIGMIVLVPLILVFIPILLLTILLGTLLGLLPLVMVGAVASIFFAGPVPWIMGGLVAFPIFLLVMISPFLFVSGLFEVYKSSMWTLAFRELRVIEDQALKPVEKAVLSV